ncbi:hypothetical protein C5167_008224 [Papaver somniferum]|uniref:Neprosin PEP catalytic domain-containing protein n=1 Tax=Papaver somniferum TaxID=3469 RepID=A0A4Y7JWV0_PAPSO|nr:uncharacterized protein LOC113285389 [Papaver somniferum]RZC64530.1 hypothetical protein C5167_008224 [Papaver somniferum]
MEYSNHSLVVLFLLISFILTAETHIIDGIEGSTSRKQKEDVNLERQLQVLNKKPIKTITTKFGDTIDCINIHKQPAFDHPLLRNHKIQMVPSSFPEYTSNKHNSTTIFQVWKINNGSQSKRCPLGTIPVRRTKKEDLVLAQKLLRKADQIHTNAYTFSHMNHHFVSVEELSEGKAYFGGAANMSVHGLELNSDEFSTSQIWIQNGPSEKLNSIEFGWMAYPTFFGDNSSRLFGYWTADGSKQTGCFNMLCPGFVQVHNEISFGADFDPISVYGEDACVVSFQVRRDPPTGNWWLIVDGINIGYWPKEIFTHLASHASVVRYGGIAGSKSQMPTPSMGNGYLPQLQDFLKTAYMTRMKYADEKGQFVNINPYGVQTKQDTSLDCYNILFAGNLGSDWEISMAFGGPGGMCP